MFKSNWWDLRAEANAGEGGGGGQQQQSFNVAEARTFLTNYVPDAKVLEGMPDDQVAAYHGRVTGELTKAQQQAIEKYDWRAPIVTAKPDAKATVDRFASPVALFESYDQLRSRLAKGELKAVTEFPKTGTAEQQNQWRAENGIPDAPEKYELKKADGKALEVGEGDKPLVDGYLKYAHEHNLPVGAVNANVNWFMETRAANQQKAAEQFDQLKTETAAELGKEWGGEYTKNKNLIAGVLDATIPSDQKELRELVDKAIATNPNFARHYAQIALQLNPAGTLVPGDRGANEGSVVDEIKKIDKVMQSDRKTYDRDEAMRTRYRELLGAYSKLTGKEWSSQ